MTDEPGSLWRLQRRYFHDRGPEAWRGGEVPHYITSNPLIAETYARLVLAFLRDRAGDADPQPLQIIELGAGSGRFAYHFLDRLETHCAAAGQPRPPLRYIMTDLAESNLAHWRAHPWLARHFAAGWLDRALFDVADDGELVLEVSGERIGEGDLRQPPVVIANYLFDSVPQDAYRLSGGRAWRAEPRLARAETPDDAAATLASAELEWDYAPLSAQAYPEPVLQTLFDGYRAALTDTHLLFPATAMRCLVRLSRLSSEGLMLLSADKGQARLEDLDGRGPPTVARHGSISMSVNYHALAAACETAGGLALLPDHGHAHIAVVCLLWLADAEGLRETRAAYRQAVAEFGPDDFYSLTQLLRARLDGLTIGEILTALRFSRHDAHQLSRYLPRLRALAPELGPAERDALVEVVDRCWAGYFPLGEDLDLANALAGLLYALDAFAPALTFFRRSVEIYGEDTGTLHNMAACHWMLGEAKPAEALAARILAADPDNEEARTLLTLVRRENLNS